MHAEHLSNFNSRKARLPPVVQIPVAVRRAKKVADFKPSPASCVSRKPVENPTQTFRILGHAQQ